MLLCGFALTLDMNRFETMSLTRRTSLVLDAASLKEFVLPRRLSLPPKKAIRIVDPKPDAHPHGVQFPEPQPITCWSGYWIEHNQGGRAAIAAQWRPRACQSGNRGTPSRQRCPRGDHIEACCVGRDRSPLHPAEHQKQTGCNFSLRPLGNREEDFTAGPERSRSCRIDPLGGRATYSLRYRGRQSRLPNPGRKHQRRKSGPAAGCRQEGKDYRPNQCDCIGWKESSRR